MSKEYFVQERVIYEVIEEDCFDGKNRRYFVCDQFETESEAIELKEELEREELKSEQE